MKKPIYLFLVLTLLLSLTLASAAYSNQPFNHRYQGDPHKSSVTYYLGNNGAGYYDNNGNYRYNLQKHATKPIFKGSYGNYRTQAYFNGDQRPNLFFVDYPDFGFRPYFSGGYGLGYGGFNNFYGFGGGYGGYRNFGLGGLNSFSYNRGYTGFNSYPGYNSRSYNLDFYPSYDYQYIGGCSYSYC